MKVQYPKRELQKQITYIEKKKTFVIIVLDALKLLQKAWTSITPTTIRLPHQTPETDNEDSDEEDDDIPLTRLDGLNFAEYTSVDNTIPTETLTDDDIIEDITAGKDSPDTIESDDDEQQTEEKSVPNLNTFIEMTESYQATSNHKRTLKTYFHYSQNSQLFSQETTEEKTSSEAINFNIPN